MREPALTEYDPPRPRLTGDERRRTILRASRSEFARVGYYGASTASIARVAKCSEPMLYKHFAGKLDLFMASLRDAIEQLQPMFQVGVVAAADFKRQSHEYIRQLMADPAYIQFIQLRRLAISVDEPRVRDAIEAIELETLDRVTLGIRYGIENGFVRDDVDPEYVAFCWLGFMQAAGFRETLEPGAFAASAAHVETWMLTLLTAD